MRRSAGLPFTITALGKGEPRDQPRRLLRAALEQLLAVVEAAEVEVATGAEEMPAAPKVQAFHMIAAAFRDSELALDTSQYVPRGFVATVRAFAHPHW